ncbi:MAG: GNAT family N-acetyltransferase [Actinomycetota bacterium]|nr:GNAT family N-acetyltransferase [Actinomycetota bacterium]
MPAAQAMAYASLSAMAARYEGEPAEPQQPPARVARGEARLRHLLATDPGGCWVAADGDVIVGVALALRRADFWFLSLLAVASDRQAAGIGRRLMTAALSYADGCSGAEIMASPDPKALCRYAAAGFALHPAYAAKGPLDRSLVPAGLAVRDGDLATDADLVDAVTTRLRGAPLGPDVGFLIERGARLLVVDEPAGQGFGLVSSGYVCPVGADSPAIAQRLLWAALGEATDPQLTVEWLTADQQWAIDVCLSARLPLSAGPSRCVRGRLGPLTPYLPSGLFG